MSGMDRKASPRWIKTSEKLALVGAAVILCLQTCAIAADMSMAPHRRLLSHEQRRSVTFDMASSADEPRPTLSSRQVSRLPKLFIQEVPSRYRAGATATEHDRTYGFSSLGPVLSVEHELWDSYWHAIDCWFIDQLRMSPLRTYNDSDADMIVVAASLPVMDLETQVCLKTCLCIAKQQHRAQLSLQRFLDPKDAF